MHLKYNRRTATISQSFTVDFTPEDDFRFFSSKYARKRDTYSEYQASSVSFVLDGEINLETESVGELSLNTAWNRFMVRGFKIDPKGNPVENPTSHDGFALRNRLDIANRVLALLDVNLIHGFEVSTWGEGE